MAKHDYITHSSGKVRLYIYQSDIQNATAADPYVNVSVYLQFYRSSSASSSYEVGGWHASLLGDTYTALGIASGLINDGWSGWKTVKTLFSAKGIWSVSKTRTYFSVNYQGNCTTGLDFRDQNVSLSGNITMQEWPVSGTKDTMSVASSMTMGSSYTITVTHKTTGNKNTLTWKFGSQSGTLLSSSTATSATFSPATSLGAQIPSASSGTVTFTLTTYNSSGTSLGSSTYTSTLSVPSYSLSAPTVSAAKNSYTGVGAYVANKTQTRFTLSGLPSGSYGATVTGSYVIKLGTTQQTSGTKTGTSSSTVDYTASAAGALQLTYTIKDSRGKTASTSASVTYVANAAPTIAFTVARSTSPTTSWSGTATGTYLNVSGNTATVTFSTGTAGSNSASSGNVSRSVSGTGLAETSSLSVKATITDTLGNTNSITKTITTVFAYLEATPNRVISIGRKADTSVSDRIQMGLPTYFDQQVHGVSVLTEASAVDANSYQGALINVGDVTIEEMGITATDNVSVITAWLKYVCTRYTHATRCIFEGNVYGTSNRMLRFVIYDTSDTSGGLPRYSEGELIAYNGASGQVVTFGGTADYVVYTSTLSDYVIEYGSSGIWRYRKWKSGWAECWGTIAAAEHTFAAWGTGYYSTEVGVVNYPVIFSSAPYELATPLSGNGWVSLMSSGTQQTTTHCGGYRAYRPVSGNATFGVEIYVMGTAT